MTLFLHYIIILVLFILGFFVYKKYKKSSGIFFLIFSIFYSLWYLFYTVIYSEFFVENTTLYIMRIMYFMSFVGQYSMVLFVLFFNKNIEKIKKPVIGILLFFLASFIVITYTDYFISGLDYVADQGYYLEIYGPLYSILAIAYFALVPVFSIASIWKIRKTNYINQLRLKYICSGFFIFMFLSVLFLVIFPLYGHFYFIENIIFFILPFLVSTFYAIYSFNFSEIKFKLGELFVFLLSIFWSLVCLNVIKSFYLNFGSNFTQLWGITLENGFFDISVAIVFFLIFNRFFTKLFLGNTANDMVARKLGKLKKEIPYITNLGDLNNYLHNEFEKLLKIKYIKIELCDPGFECEMSKYFTNTMNKDVFINDEVFLVENKNKFDRKKLEEQLNPKTYLILPLRDNNLNVVGILGIGKKPFKDSYYSQEIDILKDFRYFIEGHLKYIGIYQKIHELSFNLDKKVDEKTIEYNNLINKQKEFIALVSHEVKGPLAGSIFQIDCLLDDVKDGKYDKKYLKKELGVLNEQLLKSGDLINKLFSIQTYDAKSFKLFIENINIMDLLETEIALFQKMHTGVKFELDISQDLGYVKIDKIQFKQVIDNLLTNAVKFVDKNNPIIQMKVYEKKKHLCIEIEDNGPGLKSGEIENIFEKYVTGKTSSVGLGMGLYLCKKIVELHKGTIKASLGDSLGGARFIIKIPT